MLTLFFFLPLLALATVVHLVAGIFRFRRHRRYGWSNRYGQGFGTGFGSGQRRGFGLGRTLLPLLALVALERLFTGRRTS